ncbi:MAG: hypothetical protein GY845_35265 [Planctomycetes bacterium]|nr:hypothetical protein [Planctomycetota bacterium]
MCTETIQLASLIVAVIALSWTAYGVSLNRKTKQAEFWLKLRDDFTKYDDVHLRLRPGGDWSSEKDPNSVEEWASVEGYMGLFEHCESMLGQGLLDPKVFAKSFRYRIVNIVANSTIKQVKLIGRPDGWQRFLELCERLDISVDA